MPVKNRLREIRHELYINTQLEMAQKLGLRQNQYNRYEKQLVQPTLEIALRIAEKLKIPLEQIFYLDSD
jgi:putative transcriptional regulator